MKREAAITFKIEYHWTPERLIIECPSAAARDFVARSFDEQLLIIRTKKRRSN